MVKPPLSGRSLLRSIRAYRQRLAKTAGRALLLAVVVASTWNTTVLADAQDSVHDQLQARWYVTEVILFSYDRPLAAGESALLTGAEQDERVQALLEARTAAREAELAGAIDKLRSPAGRASASSVTEDVAERATDDGVPAVDDGLSFFEFMPDGDNGPIYRENLERFEADLQRLALQWLPEEDLALQAAAETLDRRGNSEVLLHGAWLQAIPDRGAPVPQSINAGPAFFALGETHHLLEGAIDVTLGRYLHVHPALYYHAGLTQEQIEQYATSALINEEAAATNLPRRSQRTAGVEVRDLSSAARRGEASVISGDAFADPMADAEAPLEALPAYYEMQQSRRVRSGELHYIDHPAFGVLVQVLPVAIPEMLIEQFEALAAEAG